MISKICIEERLLIKYCLKKHLILLRIQNQHKIASMVSKVIDKMSKGGAVRCTAKSAIKCKTDTRADKSAIPNQQSVTCLA